MTTANIRKIVTILEVTHTEADKPIRPATRRAAAVAVIENPFAAGFGKIIQGALESSNVNVVQELVDMIETQRAYEVNSKAITSVDEMLRFVSNNL